MNLKDYIRSIPDYPKKGILFRDITTLIKNHHAFEETINQIIEKSKKYQIDKIAAVESRGFVFASAVSYLLKKSFIMLRKKNKLPADVHSVDFELEYGTATIEVHKDSIKKNESVLIIDDLIATGGTAEAAAKLVEISKGKVAAFIFVIDLFDLILILYQIVVFYLLEYLNILKVCIMILFVLLLFVVYIHSFPLFYIPICIANKRKELTNLSHMLFLDK